MALIFMDGFDKYGAANTNSAAVIAMLTAGEWNSVAAIPTIVAPLSATGQALRQTLTAGNSMSKTLPANYSRLIGGMRFQVESLGSGATGIAQFNDAGTGQCVITINGTTGAISLRNSNIGGTILATSSLSLTSGATHYLEWDITFGNAAPYQCWLNGSSLFSGTGDTTATANNTANGFSMGGGGTSSPLIIDDLYMFDTSGTTNNAVLLTSPRIETQFPSGDAAVQFATGASILGASVTRSSAFGSNAINQWRTRQFTPTRNCTLNSISFLPNLINAGINFRPVIYSDSAGLPSTLIASGSTVTGMTTNLAVTMPLTTPQVLTAGTPYWLGFMSDVVTGGNALYLVDGGSNDRIGVSTFASGAPVSPPTLSPAVSVLMWGNITGIGVNWYEVAPNPPQGNNSYLFDTTVGHEDLFTYPPLSAPPSAIYAVAVKANLSKSDAGAKTGSIRLKSGSTDSAGSAGTALAPGTSYGWMTSLYPLDPNTGAAWTLTALNAAQAGVKVET